MHDDFTQYTGEHVCEASRAESFQAAHKLVIMLHRTHISFSVGTS